MNDIQAILFNLLKEIDDICRRHDIKYYLDGGTLIGAMRHRGFLPWDDDIDITMPRDDWHRFIEVIKDGDLPENRLLEAQELDRDYMNVFGRYSDTSVTSIHKGDLFHGGGVPLDIFPLDPIPDRAAFEKYTEDLSLYTDIISLQNAYSFRYGMNEDRFSETVKRIEEEGRDPILNELENAMFSYDENDCDYYALRFGSVPFLFEKVMFGSSRRAKFEGLMCSVPERAGDYLVMHFGDDWTTVPANADRAVHNAIYNTNIDGRSFFDDYKGLIDLDEEKIKWQRRKEYLFKTMDLRLHFNKERADANAELKSLEINNKIEKYKDVITESLKNEDYGTISEIFDEYYTAQFDKEMIGRQEHVHMERFASPAFIDIPDEYLEIAIRTLINTNRVAKAYRLLQIRRQVKGPLTEEMIHAEDTILRFRKIISSHDVGKVDDAVALAEEMYADDPNMMSLEMYLIKGYMETERYEEANDLIEKCMASYPEDGYFKKYKGDYYRRCLGDLPSAIRFYDEAKQTTNDGVVLLEIKEIMETVDAERRS